MIKEYLAVVEKAPPRETGRLTDMLRRTAGPTVPGWRRREQQEPGRRCGIPLSGEAALRSGAAENQASDRKTSSDPGSAGTCGHAIAGDRKYNPKGQKHRGELGLCAAALSFLHPVTGERLWFRTKPQGKRFLSFDLKLDERTDSCIIKGT